MKHSKPKISLVSVKHAFSTIIWPRRKLLATGLILIAVNRAAGLVLPGSTKFLVDKVIANQNQDLLWILLAAVVAAVVFQAGTSFVLTRLLSVEAQNLIAQLRLRIQKHLIRLPTSYFDNHRSGELVSRVMNDVEGVRNLVGTGLVQLTGGILTAVASFIILLTINVWMTLSALIPLAIFGTVSFRAFKKIRPIFRERSRLQAEVTGRLTETLGGIRVIKGFHAEDREIKVFSDGVNMLFLNVKQTLTTIAVVSSLAILLLGLDSALIMGMGGHFAIKGSMTVGDFIAFTLYLAFLVAPIVQMSNIGSQITEAFAGLDRMEDLLAIPGEGQEKERTHFLDQVHGEIIFSNVHFAYEKGKEVLHDINLRIPAGNVIALVGSSGSGKTTLAGLAASFLNPTSGKVTIDGYDLNTVDLGSFRSKLGVVLQDDFLFEGTIRDNLLFVRPDANEEELNRAITKAHVIEFTSRMEKGLDTIIGERGIKLSGGQRQRLAIARALLANPRILILDEATSSLDAESERLIQKSLGELMQQRTTIVIAHRLSTIRKADTIVVIESGKIVEKGNHEELMGSQGRYHELFTYQSRI